MAEEVALTLRGGAGAIEARRVPGDPLLVIAHPHPLYGGSMESHVVRALRDAVTAHGFGALRFNFRGVGGSAGVHDGGEGETRDVVALCRSLYDAGDRDLHLAGYSFGSWIALRAAVDLPLASLILVAPPVDLFGFGELALPDAPTLVMAGTRDQYGARASVEAWLADRPTGDAKREVVWFDGADHFLIGAESRIAAAVTAFLGIG